MLSRMDERNAHSRARATARRFDVIIVGGGPAGLSAALVLGRCRRDVLVIDSASPRNARSRGIHGYLTRDGIAPAELRDRGRAEAARYGVSFAQGEAIDAWCSEDGAFGVEFHEGSPGTQTRGRSRVTVRARKLLLATGVRDILPDIEGLEELYGVSVHHCPYCDGWEHRDERLVAYADGDDAINLAVKLRAWSEDVAACTDGGSVSSAVRERAARARIPVFEARVRRFSGSRGRLERIELSGQPPITCDAVFFNTGQTQRSNLPRMLGCRFGSEGGVRTTDRQAAGVRGLYLAGDADRDVQFAIVAAAEGATAAVAIHQELEDDRRDAGSPTSAARRERGSLARG